MSRPPAPRSGSAPPPPPPPPGTSAAYAEAPQDVRTDKLVLYFQDDRHVVPQKPFVVGRGKQGVDLRIDDKNISRRHFKIDYVDGEYLISDLGSTNGVEYHRQRIAQKAIEPGDTFSVAQFEFVFVYE